MNKTMKSLKISQREKMKTGKKSIAKSQTRKTFLKSGIT